MEQDKTTHPLIHRAHDFFFKDVTQRGFFMRGLLYLTRLITLLVREFVKDLCPQRAAALAYTSVLSLVPVLALFVLYFKVAGKLAAFSDKIQNWILETFVAESAQNVTVYLDQFVENIHTKTLGAFGALGLVVSAYLLFRTIERSLNDIWKVRLHRSFFARFQILSSLLIIVPAFMAGSLYVSGKFQELKVLGSVELLTTRIRTLYFMVPFLLTLLPFFLIFKFLPNTKVRWKSSLLSAIFASLLFEFAKAGFNFYVLHVINVNKIYGTLGLFPVLLLWIYFSWVIILLGVELSYVLQNFQPLYEEALQNREVGPLDIALHEEWGLILSLALARRFEEGVHPITLEDLATDLGLKPQHVEDHLIALMQGGLIAKIQSEEETGYLFSRPLNAIHVKDIKNTFRTELGLKPRNEPGDEKTLSELL